jgi:hypothetical protein
VDCLYSTDIKIIFSIKFYFVYNKKILTLKIACGKKINTYTILIGKPQGMRSCRRYICMWEDNIEMNLTDIGWGGIDYIDLA